MIAGGVAVATEQKRPVVPENRMSPPISAVQGNTIGERARHVEAQIHAFRNRHDASTIE